MKSKHFFAAMGTVLAIAAVGSAAVGHLPGFHSAVRTSPVRFAEPTDAPPNRIDCFIGMQGEPGNLFRGWICVREQAPKLAN